VVNPLTVCGLSLVLLLCHDCNPNFFESSVIPRCVTCSQAYALCLCPDCVVLIAGLAQDRYQRAHQGGNHMFFTVRLFTAGLCHPPTRPPLALSSPTALRVVICVFALQGFCMPYSSAAYSTASRPAAGPPRLSFDR
jgi:hypothetical protein